MEPKEIKQTKVVGVMYEGRQRNINNINTMTDELVVVPEPENAYDENALHVFIQKPNGGRETCGYFNRFLARDLSEAMAEGKQIKVCGYSVVQGKAKGVVVEYYLE